MLRRDKYSGTATCLNYAAERQVFSYGNEYAGIATSVKLLLLVCRYFYKYVGTVTNMQVLLYVFRYCKKNIELL